MTGDCLCSAQSSARRSLHLPGIEGVCGGLAGALAGKLRVLVLNQLQYLDYADQVIFLEEGRIASQGTLEEVSGNEAFLRMLNEYNSKAGQQEEGESGSEGGDGIEVRRMP